MRAREVRSVTYLTRLPPSPSGVALYARTFLRVLESLAPTTVLPLPPSPTDSQRMWVTLRTAWRATRETGAGSDRVVYVELAGRGLAEFWTAYLLTRRRWKRRVWLTVHDAPAVCGGAFFFSSLDRRGGRRIARTLSDTIGRRAERALLEASERAYCLSAVGANELAARLSLSRPVRRLPHVAAATATPMATRRSILLPGYVDGIDNIAPVLRALVDAPSDWRMEVGACGPPTRADVLAQVREMGLEDRVRLLGYLDEDGLADAFERAAIVVRWRAEGWEANGRALAAVSGPLIRAMAHGCAIVTNDNRGIRECLSEATAVHVGNGAEGEARLRSALVTLVRDQERRERMGAAGREHILSEHQPEYLVSVLMEG